MTAPVLNGIIVTMANAVAMQVDTGEFVAKYASIFCPHRGDSVEVFKKFDLPEHRNILEQAYDYFCRGEPLPLRGEDYDYSKHKIRQIYLAMYDKVFRKLNITRDPAKSRFIKRIQDVKRGMPNDISAADEAWLNEHLDAVLPECITCGHMMPGTQYVDYACECNKKYFCVACHNNRVEVARLNDIACQEDPSLARIFVRCPGCHLEGSEGITPHVVPPVVLNQTISDEAEDEVQERPRAFQRLDDDPPPNDPVIAQEEDPVAVLYAQLEAARREAEHERREREHVQQVAAAEIANRDAALANQAQVIMQQGASSSRADHPIVQKTQEMLQVANSNVLIAKYIQAEGVKNASEKKIELEKVVASSSVDAIQKQITATQHASANYAPDLDHIEEQFNRMGVNSLECIADALTWQNDMACVSDLHTATIEEFMRDRS